MLHKSDTIEGLDPPVMPGDKLLRPDNHKLFFEVRAMIMSHDPVHRMTDIAAKYRVTVEGLCRWLLTIYHEPVLLPHGHTPDDPQQRAELGRLREREASLVTTLGHSPVQLAAVQRRIKVLARLH